MAVGGQMRHSPAKMLDRDSSFSPAQQRMALALAQSIIPGSGQIPPADDHTVQHTQELLGELGPALQRPFAAAQRLLDGAAIASTGRPLHALSAERRDALLQRWSGDPVLKLPLMIVSLAYKIVHFDQPHVYKAMGRERNVVTKLEQPRWLSQIHRGASWDGGDVECDVVVVGTGAGGAVVGRELAERGHAVVFVEEGEHHRRDVFDGSSLGAHKRFFRFAASVGNAVIPIFIGRLVGGSTAVNGGTCFRTPPWVLDRWCEELNTDEFADENMARYFERVEEVLQVAPSPRSVVGPIQDVISRGCERLGWSHFAIRRNAPGCDGKGFCDFGCRTDARRSTNISYIPPALQAGALLLTGLTADRVLLQGDRAVGLLCTTRDGRSLRVHARKVVLAGGAVPTPLFLLKQGLGNKSGQVGRNLTLHPSSGVSGLFDEEIHGARHVPQGYGCDHFLRSGQLITAAQADTNFMPMLFPFTGQKLMQTLALAPRIGSLAVLIRDQTRNGRVWREVGGQPAITYNLTAADTALLHKTMVAAAEILVAAGASRLYPVCMSLPMIESRDLDKLRKLKPTAMEMSPISYHPLGTCRMGKDPRDSVVGLDHQTHDVRGLYITDGSTTQGPLGVNPQVTIMAMATRAAEHIAAAL